MIAVIGIDPGKSGGIASINDVGRIIAAKLPATTRDLYELIDSLATAGSYVFVESVHAGPKMGSCAAFKFGQGVGEIHMACIALELPVHYVAPQKWQRALGLLSKARGLGEGDTAKKNHNKARAQELFPGIKITHHIADALLIAEYGRRSLQLVNGAAKHD